jgi:acetyltransferase-like isoleucine patch superfamily enzyme
MISSLNKLEWLRESIVYLRRLYLTRFWGMDIHRTAGFSRSARFDRTYPRGVHVGEDSFVAFNATILTHDTTRRLYLDTWIGRRCFIGAGSIVLPGIRIGDECVIGAGAVVTKDVPAHSVVAGNPAKVIRNGVRLERFGRFRKPTGEEASDAA